MVFHWSLSDRKSPQIYMTLLSILVDLNKVWTVTISPVIFRFSCPCTNHLVTVRRATITVDKIFTFIFHSFFSSLARSRYITLSLSYNFICCPQVICLFLKISEKFVPRILQDWFWVVHIPFVRMIKFQFLAQFTVDHLVHPVVSSLIFFLCWFAVFAYWSFRLSHHITYICCSCFDIVSHYGVILCSYWKRFSFSLKVSLS